jgi:hypothetical protein
MALPDAIRAVDKSVGQISVQLAFEVPAALARSQVVSDKPSNFNQLRIS